MVKKVSGSSTNSNNIGKILTENNQDSFFCSTEQIYSPVKIRRELVSEQGDFPEFKKPDSISNADGKFDGKHVGPTSKELNPYFALGVNTDFQLVAHDNESRNLSIVNKDHNELEHVRTTAFRGPLMLSGWGYDICDQPVIEELKDAAQDRTKYKSGPVDLKWDDERGVWSGGPQIVEGVLITDIEEPSSPNSPTEFTVSLRRGKSWANKSETIVCKNRDPSLSVSITPSSNIYVMAIRINYEWRPLWVGCE